MKNNMFVLANMKKFAVVALCLLSLQLSANPTAFSSFSSSVMVNTQSATGRQIGTMRLMSDKSTYSPAYHLYSTAAPADNTKTTEYHGIYQHSSLSFSTIAATPKWVEGTMTPALPSEDNIVLTRRNNIVNPPDPDDEDLPNGPVGDAVGFLLLLAVVFGVYRRRKALRW